MYFNIKKKNLIIIILIVAIIILLIVLLSIYKNNIEKFEDKLNNSSKGKIAFLFLTYNNLKRPDIWNKYFENVPESQYSIYLHAKEPEKVSDNILKGHQIAKHIETSWGSPSLVEANILMMEEALKDSDNKKFFIVSDSCCPIMSFADMYNMVMNDDKSILGIHKYNPNPERYDAIINPKFPKEQFIKHCGSGTMVNRKHAQLLVNSLDDFKNNWKNFHVPDEHYFGNALLSLDKDFKFNNNSYKLTFDTWQMDDLDKSFLNLEEEIKKDGYINLKSVSNKGIDAMRKAGFAFMRKVGQDCKVDSDYLLK